MSGSISIFKEAKRGIVSPQDVVVSHQKDATVTLLLHKLRSRQGAERLPRWTKEVAQPPSSISTSLRNTASESVFVFPLNYSSSLPFPFSSALLALRWDEPVVPKDDETCVYMIQPGH